MKIITITLLLISISCTPSVPACSDKSTISLVRDIFADNGLKPDGLKANKMSYEVVNIRTRSTESSTGKHICAADVELKIHESNRSTKFPIEYTVENLDSGDRMYVTVLSDGGLFTY